MAIQGPLRELGIHDVFQLLDLGRKTGALLITSELRQNEGTIWFHEAAVVAAAIQSNPHPLGTALRRAGKIREEDLLQARAAQDQGDQRRIGEILVAAGALSARELTTQVRAHIEDVVFTMLGGRRGTSSSRSAPPRRSPGKPTSASRWSICCSKGRGGSTSGRGSSPAVAHVGVIPRLAPPVSNEAGSLSLTPVRVAGDLGGRCGARCAGHRALARGAGVRRGPGPLRPRQRRRYSAS
jgi:hypothetical protein